MRTWLRLAVLGLPLLASTAGRGSPLDFDLGNYDASQALEDTAQPRDCTVTYLVEDFVTNETFAARMQFTPAPHAIALKGHLPCPTFVPPRVTEAALEGCREHADKKADCVFADMSRGFHESPLLSDTSENAARCASDQASQIAIACRNAGNFDVCNVGCGEDRDAAILAARNRCQAKHRTACPITGALPVRAP
ncbi:MAG TPA: hypothetical protein VND19_01865 [Acetobacteraceae bacterium]|nr:hypothetical protein [Acetobacteraceae bacterium]